jgi:hypothetical protein
VQVLAARGDDQAGAVAAVGVGEPGHRRLPLLTAAAADRVQDQHVHAHERGLALPDLAVHAGVHPVLHPPRERPGLLGLAVDLLVLCHRPNVRAAAHPPLLRSCSVTPTGGAT